MIKDLTKLSETDIAYIAGLLERASFSLSYRGSEVKRKQEYRANLRFLSFEDEILLWLQERIGGKFYCRNSGPRTGMLCFSGKKAIPLITVCYKYLKQRRSHANLFLLFCATLRDPTAPRFGRVLEVSEDEVALREKLFLEFQEYAISGGYSKKQIRKIVIKDLPPAIKGLFDFGEDFDGFGETITPTSGFFDAFINHLLEDDNEHD